MLQKFWDEANALSRQKAASGYQTGYGAGAQQMGVAPAAVAPAYAAQPFQTGAQMPMGMQPGTQNSIPQVPANAKITSNTNPAAFMGQQQQMAPAVPNVQMPAPIPAAAAPVTPAFAPNPAFAPAPAAPAPAPVVENGIEEETVAAIMGALSAMYAGSGKKPVLKGVKAAKPRRSAWSAAGVMENTRPF